MDCPPPCPPPPPDLLTTLRQYVSLRCGHPLDHPPTQPLHQQIAQLTSQYTDQTPYPLPPLPSSIAALSTVSSSSSPTTTTATTATTATTSTTSTTSTSTTTSTTTTTTTTTNTNNTKKHKKHKRKKAKKYKPKVLNHAQLHHFNRTMNNWESNTPMISSFFSWEEWTSEQLRTGSLLLQHHCAKYFQTTWNAASTPLSHTITSSLLFDMRQYHPLSSSSSSSSSSRYTTNEDSVHAGLMVEHLAVGQPNDAPPFQSSWKLAMANNRQLRKAGALSSYLTVLETTTAAYFFDKNMQPKEEPRVTPPSAWAVSLRKKKKKLKKSKKNKQSKKSKHDSNGSREAKHMGLWRILNCLYMLMITHERDRSFRQELSTITIGTTKRSVSSFVLELLSHTITMKQTGAKDVVDAVVFPIRKLIAIATLSVQMQCGSLMDYHHENIHPPVKKPLSPTTDATDTTKPMPLQKPQYSKKARKGKQYDALFREQEQRVDAALSGVVLGSNCSVLSTSTRLRQYTTNKAHRTTTTTNHHSNTKHLFQELQPHLRTIAVVLMQLLISCTPRKGKLQQQLLLDNMQDLTLERLQPTAFIGATPLVCSIDKQSKRNDLHNMYISRCVSQIALHLLKSFRYCHVLYAECWSQHLVDAKAVLTGLSWLNCDLWSMIVNKNNSVVPVLDYFIAETQGPAPIPTPTPMWQVTCINILRMMQRLTKKYSERITNSLMKYNSSIILHKILVLFQKENDSAVYYALKLLKSQARYLMAQMHPGQWREQNMNVINGVARNVRTDLSDYWLVTQDSTSKVGTLGSSSSIHHPTEATSQWAVHQFLNPKPNPTQPNNDSSPLFKLSMLVADAEEEDDRIVESGVDGMLCLDGLEGEALLSLATGDVGDGGDIGDGGDGGDGDGDGGGGGTTMNVEHSQSVKCKHFQVNGVGTYALYNDSATNVPNDFFDDGGWSKWLACQNFLL